MSVPDHLIEKAARARAEKLGLGWDATHPESRRAYAVQSRVAIEAVAGELRAEGARAERERIARAVDRSAPGQWPGIAAAIRNGVRSAS